MANKVRFNIKNVHYATFTIGDEGNPTYGVPVKMPGAVSLSLDAEGGISPFYADGIVYYNSVANNGYTGDLEMALISEKFRMDILGETQDDTTKALVENVNNKTNPFALLFEFDGDEKSIRHVLYNCSATRPSMEGNTTTDTKEPDTETLTLSAAPLASGLVKSKTGNETPAATYDTWYQTVFTPTAESGGE